MKTDYSKGASLVIVGGIYLISFGLGFLFFGKLAQVMPELWALFLADVIATVAVWAFGLLYKNVSVYDPYWSVFPPVALTVWALCKGSVGLLAALLLTAVWCWGIRLTGNWAYTFKGLAHEDWRYTRYRETLPAWQFQLVNLFGLNMMPTVLVFVCMLPGLGLFEGGARAGAPTWAGFAMCIAAATIELVADTQMHRFRAAHPGAICETGLWKHGRHPNYFGEILMWWGVWVMYASVRGADWYILGPVAMTLLFLFISVPMMERRQLERKPGYADYVRHTRMFI